MQAILDTIYSKKVLYQQVGRAKRDMDLGISSLGIEA